MLKEVKAALTAAEKYKIRNEGDRPEAELIRAMLSDVLRHAEGLDQYAEVFARKQRVAAAQDELRAAEANVAPDSQLTP